MSESKSDFIGETGDGTKIEIEIKGIEGTGKQPLEEQTANIIANIKDDILNAKDPSKFKTICDLSTIPNFFRKKAYTDISNGLEPSELAQTDFLFD